MKKRTTQEGEKFGKLTIVKEVEPNITPCGTKQRKFLCRCECGNEVFRTLQTLLHGNGTSCGCNDFHIGNLNKKYTKEQASSFIYHTWTAMKQRCYYKKCRSYKNYGARGISICKEWRFDYLSFYYWSLENGAKKGLSIDRIDVDDDYKPSNCRWANAKTQSRNKTTTRYIVCNNEKKSLAEWSELYGISESTIRKRIDTYGYTIEEALEVIKHEKVNHKIRKYNWKKIIQFSLDGEFIKVWDGVNDIAKAFNCSTHCIRMCCYGRTKTSVGYIWKYKTSEVV